MIEIAKSLPPAAILGPEVEGLKNALNSQKAIWFRAQEAFVSLETDKDGPWVSSWKSAIGETVAKPTRPNNQGGRFDLDNPIPAMCFRKKTHCGYSAEPISQNAERFSIAAIYQSPNQDAHSIFSVGGADMDNILFANEVDGTLKVQDRRGAILIECNAPTNSDRYALLVVSYEMGKLRVSINGNPAIEMSAKVSGLTGPAKLFIGCRNHRPGLMKTLGTSRISDVIFWPDRMILGPEVIYNDPSVTLLRDYWQWNR